MTHFIFSRGVKGGVLAKVPESLSGLFPQRFRLLGDLRWLGEINRTCVRRDNIWWSKGDRKLSLPHLPQ